MKKRQKSPAKREAILNGAMSEFLAHGFNTTTMDHIAAAAGVSKATVYAHFGDKESLFEVLIQRLAEDKLRALHGSVEEPQPDQSSAEVLRTTLLSLLTALREDKAAIAFVRLLLMESGRSPAVISVFINAFDKPIVHWLTTYLANHPEFGLSDTEAVARIFLATIHHEIFLNDLLGVQEINPVSSERLVAALITLITQGGNLSDTIEEQ